MLRDNWAIIFGVYSNGLTVKRLDSKSRGPGLKPFGDFKVDSGFYLSEVDQMSNRISWELSGKK